MEFGVMDPYQFLQRIQYEMGAVASVSAVQYEQQTVISHTTITSLESTEEEVSSNTSMTSTTVTAMQSTTITAMQSTTVAAMQSTSVFPEPSAGVSSKASERAALEPPNSVAYMADTYMNAMNAQKETAPHSTQASGSGSGDLNSAQLPEDDDIIIVYDEKVDCVDLCNSDSEDPDPQTQEKQNLPAFESRAHKVNPRLGKHKTRRLQAKNRQKSTLSEKEIIARIIAREKNRKRKLNVYGVFLCHCGRDVFKKNPQGPSHEGAGQVDHFYDVEEVHDMLAHYHQVHKPQYCPRCGFTCLSARFFEHHAEDCDAYLKMMTTCYVSL